jgi:hypothetical protein
LEATEEELRSMSDACLPWETLHLAQVALEAYCLVELAVEQRVGTNHQGVGSPATSAAGLSLSSETVKDAAVLAQVQRRMRNMANTARVSLIGIAEDLAKRAAELKSDRSARSTRLATSELRRLSIVSPVPLPHIPFG